jgi:Chaperone of endosialidase
MAVPYTFGSATTSIPLSQLDSNFATTITLGNTAIQLGNTVTTLNNMTLANATVSATNITATNITSPLSTALTLQSNAGNTAVTIDTSQNVGIGTSSPSQKLHVYASSGDINTQVETAGAGQAGLNLYNSTRKYRLIADASANAFYIYDQTAGAERMRISSNGNLLIGATSQAAATSGYMLGLQSGGTQTFLSIAKSGQTLDSGGMTLGLDAGASYLNIRENIPLTFGTNNAERMRIDSSGYLLVGCTALPSSSVAGVAFSPSVVSVNPHSFSAGSSTGVLTLINFKNGNGTVGAINTSGSNTVYATSSDYRLKKDIAPMTGSLEKVSLLKPCTYKWKSDNSNGQGFIAHELAEVFPDAVVGEKDAVDADGEIKPQQIDTSFLVATLTAAIQEQQALITAQAETINALTARIVALEAK